jgi:hypothetical protein
MELILHASLRHGSLGEDAVDVGDGAVKAGVERGIVQLARRRELISTTFTLVPR